MATIHEELCPRCDRPHPPLPLPVVYTGGTLVTVSHGFYGCESGCCGHEICLWNAQGHVLQTHFAHVHPYGLDTYTADQRKDFIVDLAHDSFPDVPIAFDCCQLLDD